RGAVERRREVEMQAAIDAMLPRERGGALGVLHEDHRARGGDGAADDAVEDHVRGLRITSPVVRVQDEKASAHQEGDPESRSSSMVRPLYVVACAQWSIGAFARQIGYIR